MAFFNLNSFRFTLVPSIHSAKMLQAKGSTLPIPGARFQHSLLLLRRVIFTAQTNPKHVAYLYTWTSTDTLHSKKSRALELAPDQ